MSPQPADLQLPSVPETPGGKAAVATGVCVPAAMRLDYLFRGWLRDRHVHPLIHLMRQYRARGTP
jgi:hypothetical protein